MTYLSNLLGGGYTSGYSGVSGASTSGYSGVSGGVGSTGTSGYSGASITGASGYSGISGSNGSVGTSGYSGTNGTSGYSGISGTNGTAGTSGYSGVGTSGYSGALGPVNTQQQIDINMFGFMNQTDTTIAFDGTSTFTLAPAAGGSNPWTYYRSGIKYTVNGSKTATISAGTSTTTIYFIYIDATDGTLSVSTTPWTLNDTKVTVATVTRNSTLTPSYLLGEERHTCLINRRDHMQEHYTAGTLFSSGAVLTGPTVGSSTNSAKTVASTISYIFDEDIYESVAAITAGNGSTDAFYSICYRTTATTWAWARSVMPFKYTGAAAIEYDAAGTMTPATTGATRFVNYYMVLTNMNGQESTVWVPGRTVFTSATTAYTEDFASFTMTGFPMVEAVAIYQFTWDVGGSGLGLCRLNRTPVRISKNIVSSSSNLGAVVSTISNGNSEVSIPVANANVTISVAGTSNVMVISSTGANITGTGNISGNVQISGTANIANLSLVKYEELVVTGGNTGASTITPDANARSIFTYTLTGNITLSDMANVSTGTSATIILTQDATGNRLLTSTMKFAGESKTLSTAANSIDVMSVFYSGSTYYATLSKGYA